MSHLAQLWRLLTIQHTLLCYGLDRFLLETHGRWLRILLLLMPWVLLHPRRRRGTVAVRVRMALVHLGPIFVKFGQTLSTRRDLLTDDIADELAKLQDQVPPFSRHIAKDIIERTYSRSLHELFSEFDHKPLASASIAQVYAAKLHGGSNVVVKVLRPKVEKRIRKDVAVMMLIARLAETCSTEARRLHLVDIVKEYKKTILDELDLVREAANASQLKRNFAHSPLLYIPNIHWPLATENVMVMERIYGIPIGDIATLTDRGVNMRCLAERGVEIFFAQVFRDNFFHADMHPGNIFVDISKPDDPRYIAVDFGIMGTLSPEDKHYLAQNFLAFFDRDYFRVAQLHIESGWMKADTRIDEFESAVRSACEPIFEKPLAEISFGKLLLRLFKVARRYGYEVQPQLVLLQKTLLNIEGLGRQLYPQLNLWTTARPFLEQWMSEQAGPADLINRLRKVSPTWLSEIPEIPLSLKKLVEQISTGRLTVNWQSQVLSEYSARLLLEQKRNRRNRLACTLLIIAALLPFMDLSLAIPDYLGLPITSWSLIALGLALLL